MILSLMPAKQWQTDKDAVNVHIIKQFNIAKKNSLIVAFVMLICENLMGNFVMNALFCEYSEKGNITSE